MGQKCGSHWRCGHHQKVRSPILDTWQAPWPPRIRHFLRRVRLSFLASLASSQSPRPRPPPRGGVFFCLPLFFFFFFCCVLPTTNEQKQASSSAPRAHSARATSTQNATRERRPCRGTKRHVHAYIQNTLASHRTTMMAASAAALTTTTTARWCQAGRGTTRSSLLRMSDVAVPSLCGGNTRGDRARSSRRTGTRRPSFS